MIVNAGNPDTNQGNRITRGSAKAKQRASTKCLLTLALLLAGQMLRSGRQI